MDLNPEPLSYRIKVAAFITFVLLLLLVVPGRWVGLGKMVYEKDVAPTEMGALSVDDVTADSDNDGVPNWKENLIGTSPKAKNVPVDEGVNAPTLSAEDQKLLSRLDDPNNITSQLLKNSVGLSSYLDASGATDAATVGTVATNVAVEADKLAAPRIYVEKDLNISNDEVLSAIKSYGNNMGGLFLNTYTKLDITSMLDPLQKYQATKDISYLKTYNTKVVFLDSVLKDLTSIVVPASAVESHLFFTNAVEKYRLIISGFSVASSDPARALISIRDYEQSVKVLAESLIVNARYFNNKSAIFTQKEGGYIFTRVILTK